MGTIVSLNMDSLFNLLCYLIVEFHSRIFSHLDLTKNWMNLLYIYTTELYYSLKCH